MECERIRELLSPYVDDALDTHSRMAVEEHVAVCGHCAAELDDLTGYLQTMASLPRFKAPPGFLESVHHRLERTSLSRRMAAFARSLVYSRAPLKWAGGIAATLLVVGITYHSLYLYKEIEYAPRPAQVSTPPESSEARRAPAGPPPTEADASRTEETSMAYAPSPVTPSPKPIELTLFIKLSPATVWEGKRNSAAPKASRDLTARMTKEKGDFRSRAERSLMQRPTGTPPTVQEEERLSPGSETVFAEKQAGKALGSSAVENGSEPVKEKELESSPASHPDKQAISDEKTRRGNEQALDQVVNALKSAGGKDLKLEYDEKKPLPQFIRAEVPADGLPALLDRLNRIGGLSQPAQPPLPSNGLTVVEVRIKLMFPL